MFLEKYLNSNLKTELSNNVEVNKKIAIYGFNTYGEEYFVKFFKSNSIVGIYDINYKTKDIYIENPDKISNESFDYIVVTVINDISRKKIFNFLKQKGVSQNKIIYCNIV